MTYDMTYDLPAEADTSSERLILAAGLATACIIEAGGY